MNKGEICLFKLENLLRKKEKRDIFSRKKEKEKRLRKKEKEKR